MDSIRLKFVDFRAPFHPTLILRLLKTRFSIEVVEYDPDYVIFSVFGNEHLQYLDAIKILFTGENLRPDFNTCDYAFAFDWLEFGDRYYRCPNYQLYDQFKDLCSRRRSNVAAESLATKSFCNFVYTNRAAHPYRDDLFRALSEYHRVESAGRHLNNVGFTPGNAYEDGWQAAKVAFQRGYKFTVACENSSTPGYTTEKIVDALAADTIPIYFGNPLITRDFNAGRFVNCHDFASLADVVAFVAALDRDDDSYAAMVAQPFFGDDRVPEYLEDRRICDKFAYIFQQPKELARRRSVHYWGWVYEEQRRYDLAAGRLLLELDDALDEDRAAAAPDRATKLRAIRSKVAKWRLESDLSTPYDF